MAVCYNIGSYHSNAWKSDNPNSGVYEADKSKTLDALNCGYPGCNQGGTAVVEPTAYLASGKSTVGTLCAGPGQRQFSGSQEIFTGDYHIIERIKGIRYIVRRLTPLECERLQGYPDGWTDIGEWVDSKGKKHKEADSPRYKALGNSIALPPWKWVLKRLCACYERDATMASLFDGIGGFPLIWEQLNGNGSCLWASEIEEFPMAVTKLRFGGNDNENNA
jgi:DNA (cytosine-5)-methyltransferase 1